MKKSMLTLFTLLVVSSVAHAQTQISISNPNAWKPTVGDSVKFSLYEEQANSDGVYTGSLEKVVTAVDDFYVSFTVTQTIRSYETNQDVITIHSYRAMKSDVTNGANQLSDCGGNSSVPVTLKLDAGTFDACLTRPVMGKGFDGAQSVSNFFLGNVPFGTIRMDSLNIDTGNHLRMELTEIELALTAP